MGTRGMTHQEKERGSFHWPHFLPLLLVLNTETRPVTRNRSIRTLKSNLSRGHHPNQDITPVICLEDGGLPAEGGFADHRQLSGLGHGKREKREEEIETNNSGLRTNITSLFLYELK